MQSSGWTATVSTEQDNCEGPCNLRLGIDIAPEVEAIEAAQRFQLEENRGGSYVIPLPPDTLKALMQKVLPAASAAKLDVSFIGECADEAVLRAAEIYTGACTGLISSAQALIGTTDDFYRDSVFDIRGSGSWLDEELIVQSGSYSADDVLGRLQDVSSGPIPGRALG